MAATKNNRTQATTFSLKDVIVVVASMLTAVAPLVTNDTKFDSIESDLDSIHATINSGSESTITSKLKIDELKDRVHTNEEHIRQQDLEIVALKEQIRELQVKGK